MYRWTRVLTASLVIATVLSIPTAQAASVRIPYSGQLSEAGELVNGNRSMTFRICANTGCTPNALYTQTINPVLVANGAFSVLIGSDGLLQSAIFQTGV